ncbi:MAG TPA: hypothetical protein VMT05_04690 [Terriglobales bacterium]|nr:hypothetical protein [Terriglobales bacterium]
MVPYHQDPKHAAHLQEAPRCQHIRMNGRRCGSPALRGETHCYFHKRIHPRALYAADAEPNLPFIEDATSLQFALMRVMRILVTGHADYKCCALLLYSLQIAASNLKNFKAEHPQLELPEIELPPQECASGEPRKIAGKNGDDPSLAASLAGLLAKAANSDPAAGPHRVDTPLGCHAGVKRRPGSERMRSGERSSLAAG